MVPVSMKCCICILAEILRSQSVEQQPLGTVCKRFPRVLHCSRASGYELAVRANLCRGTFIDDDTSFVPLSATPPLAVIATRFDVITQSISIEITHFDNLLIVDEPGAFRAYRLFESVTVCYRVETHGVNGAQIRFTAQSVKRAPQDVGCGFLLGG